MKRCPECRRDYYDDSLIYCLDDGNALLDGPASLDEPQTAILSEPPASAGGQFASENPTRPFIHTTAAEAQPRENVGGSTERQSLSAHRAAKPLIAASVTVAVLLGGFFGYRYFSSAANKQIESIAVMPFANESGNADVEYLSDGMTETLISSLSQLPNLNVKPRSSVFRYKGKEADAQTIGKELNVQAILNGRVVQRGADVSLFVELIDVVLNKVVWSQQYNRKQSDLVSLQSDIARDVSSKLKSKLSGEEQAKVINVYTTNSEAYQLYLKGNYYSSKLTKEGTQKGDAFFEQAIQLDPDYALAYNGLAYSKLVAMDWFTEPKIAGPQALANVAKAVALNDRLVETQLLRGMAAHWVEWDWITAESSFKKAIELGPSGYRPYGYYAWLLSNLGRDDEAIALAKQGQQLDPISPEANFYLGLALLGAGRTEEAIARFQTSIELDPTYFYAYSFLGRAYLQADKKEAALAAFKRAFELEGQNPENGANLAYAYGVTGDRAEAGRIIGDLKEKATSNYVAPYYFAIAYAGLSENEDVFKWLERAYAERSDSLVLYLTADPHMQGIRSDPRYKTLLNRLNLPE
jgi:TolB-like protein/Flp pilus assembly protein TadD